MAISKIVVNSLSTGGPYWDSSGNVAVGTTTTSNGRLSVYGPGGATANSLFLTNVDGTYNSYLQIQHSLNGTNLYASSSYGGNASSLNFTTPGGSMRFDGSGNLLVGTTGNPNIGRIGVVFTTGSATAWVSKPSSDANPTTMQFLNSSGAAVGTITQTASATAFNTTSDYRLKEDVQPMSGALARVAALKPVTYKWKVDGSAGEGFIAHELQEVVPECVVGEKDAVDAEGKPIYQGIDTSFLVATLTAAIQELKAELDSVKAELAALKGA